jgi:hypothetical protein
MNREAAPIADEYMVRGNIGARFESREKLNDNGGRDDQPCPPWCVTSSGHLHHHSQHCVDLWHQGPEVIVATQFADGYRIPIEMHVRLDQEEQVDARGHSRHPVRVACGRYSLSPDQARELASVLLQMAGEAEQVAD